MAVYTLGATNKAIYKIKQSVGMARNALLHNVRVRTGDTEAHCLAFVKHLYKDVRD